jgi:hypothetical protein
MLTSDGPAVKSYPQITAQAVKLGYAEVFRLYDLVQSLVSARLGYPFFTRAELIDLELLNPQQVDRALARGRGLCWIQLSNGWYKMIARARVAVALDLPGKPGRAVLLPAAAYTGRLANFKAWSYAGYLAQRYEPFNSRDQLTDLFGVSLPTLLAWERKTGVKPRCRFVMADPVDIKGATGSQAQDFAIYNELVRHSSRRKWITIVGPRGGVYAGRRLMDNDNGELADYWAVVEAPAWELHGTPVITWQTTNDYSDTPVPVAPSGRGSWLRADIRGLVIPDVMGMGKTPDSFDDLTSDRQTRPAWHDDAYRAIKWQGRPQNQGRPVIMARYTQAAIQGTWQPSYAATWGMLR